ncbi:unnamed protein product [Symbiodinium sp. CCMP2592]|nr:unnamed protein product [Symbiodinium sp. CCMP2592]
MSLSCPIPSQIDAVAGLDGATCTASADLEMALTSLFSEVGSVVHIPDSRGGEPLLALLRRRASSEISLAGTDFSGLYKADLGMEALRKLRQDAGMAEFAWRTFLQLLSSALSGQEGCSTAASSCAAGKRLELRFRLESAVLATHLDLEAIASMPSSTEAQGFLKGLRGFVLDALAAESSAEAAKTSTSSTRFPGPMPSLSQDPLLTRAASEPPPTASMTLSRPPAATPPKKRAAGSLVDPHRPSELAASPFSFQQVETVCRHGGNAWALRSCTCARCGGVQALCRRQGSSSNSLDRCPVSVSANNVASSTCGLLPLRRCPVANSMALYTTQQLLLSVWDEVYVEAVLLLCFCFGFFLIRIAQRKLVRPFSEMKSSSKGEADKCRTPKASQRSDSPLQPLPQLLRTALDEQNANVAAEAASALLSAASPPPPSDLASLFELLRRSRGPEGAAKMLKRLPQGALTIRSITVLAQGLRANMRIAGLIVKLHVHCTFFAPFLTYKRGSLRKWRKCQHCQGSGAILQPFPLGGKVFNFKVVCPECGGACWTVLCTSCKGKGKTGRTLNLSFGGIGFPFDVEEKCNQCYGWGKLAAARHDPVKRKRVDDMTALEMRDELRKMRRKVGGTKAELKERLQQVFETNDRGWAMRCVPEVSSGTYLESGTFRDVFLVTFTKGPRKNLKGVYKVFKDAKTESLIEEDLQAVAEAGRIIEAFNQYNEEHCRQRGQPARRRVYLNQPEVWTCGDRKVLVEPLIDGTYAKFNSNSGWVNEGYNMMQALSHFSFHFSEGQRLLCDLQGGGYDTHYILTDPAVLSVQKEFGATDGGLRMMQNFFAYHLCNEYCDSSWLRLKKPRVCAPVRSGTSFFPRGTGRSTAVDAFRNKQFQRFVLKYGPWGGEVLWALLRGFANCGDAAGHREAAETLLSNLCPSEALLCGLLALCSTSQAVRLAEQFASFGVARYGPSLPLYSSLLKVYSQSKLWDKACDLHADFEKAGIAPDTATYGALIKAAVEGGRQSLARHLFQESKNPDVMNVMSMIRSAGRDRDVAKALSLLAELQRTSELDATTYNCALEACVACGDRKAAEDLMQKMTKAGHVDVVSYNTYMKLLLAMQDHTQVKITLEDMRSRGIKPNVVTYNSLIKASQQNPRQSWRLVQEMQRAGLEPDAFTCSILAAGLRHSPTSQDLDQILELMSKGGIVLDEVLLNCLLDVCIRLKDLSRLPELLRRWETTGLAPSPHASVMLMRAHGHARNLPEAWRLWRRLLDDTELTEDAFMSMVDACLATSDVKAALRVFKESRALLAGFPRAAVAFALAVKAATASQQLAAAVELYEETKGALRLTAVTYNTLIDALVRAGDLKRAMQLFRDMACQDTGPDLISFSILIKGFASSGDLETAILLLGQMQGQGIQPDSILFNSILHGCARSQRRALTEEVLADMEKAGVAPSNFTVSILVKLYGRCGDLPAALEVIEDYPKRFGFRLNTQAYTCLMSTCIWSGDLPKALDAYQRMLEDGVEADGKTFETLLSGCVKYGEAIRASQVLADALSCSVRLNRETLESAVVMAHNRNPDAASEMISRMTQAGLQPSGRLVATMAREPCSVRGGRHNTRGWKKMPGRIPKRHN